MTRREHKVTRHEPKRERNDTVEVPPAGRTRTGLREDEGVGMELGLRWNRVRMLRRDGARWRTQNQA